MGRTDIRIRRSDPAQRTADQQRPALPAAPRAAGRRTVQQIAGQRARAAKQQNVFDGAMIRYDAKEQRRQEPGARTTMQTERENERRDEGYNTEPLERSKTHARTLIQELSTPSLPPPRPPSTKTTDTDKNNNKCDGKQCVSSEREGEREGARAHWAMLCMANTKP